MNIYLELISNSNKNTCFTGIFIFLIGRGCAFMNDSILCSLKDNNGILRSNEYVII